MKITKYLIHLKEKFQLAIIFFFFKKKIYKKFQLAISNLIYYRLKPFIISFEKRGPLEMNNNYWGSSELEKRKNDLNWDRWKERFEAYELEHWYLYRERESCLSFYDFYLLEKELKKTQPKINQEVPQKKYEKFGILLIIDDRKRGGGNNSLDIHFLDSLKEQFKRKLYLNIENIKKILNLMERDGIIFKSKHIFGYDYYDFTKAGYNFIEDNSHIKNLGIVALAETIIKAFGAVP